MSKEGMATQALAGEISAAVLADENDGGCDISAGLFGPAFSAIIRKIATEYVQLAAVQEAVTWLSKDDAQLALFQAIQAIKLGNPTDDKMILANLREAGLWIGRYAAAPVAAAQEAVAYLDIGAGGYLDLGSNLPEVQLLALPKGRHALGIIGTYGIDGYVAAPVATAPVVDGRDVRAAIAGIEGSVAVGSDGEWVSVRRTARDAAVTALRNLASDCAHIYAAYAEAKASIPAAPGIDHLRSVMNALSRNISDAYEKACQNGDERMQTIQNARQSLLNTIREALPQSDASAEVIDA